MDPFSLFERIITNNTNINLFIKFLVKFELGFDGGEIGLESDSSPSI